MKMVSAIFLLAANLISNPDHKIPYSESENIRESNLDFTAHFGEINPDMLYLCRRGQSGAKREVFAFSPLFGGSR